MKCIIASTSTIYGSGYLAYLLDEIDIFFNKPKEVLFIPYARPGGISHDAYTQKAQDAFEKIGAKVKGIHTYDSPEKAIQEAKFIFTGGGNTFLLVKKLHELGLMLPLKKAITNGTFYLGTSAGSNICGPTIMTTNDMPIVYPPSFNSLGILNFNINPHYLDPLPNSTHKGETRETRIKEFLQQNKVSVLGLREGSWIAVNGQEIYLRGELSARVFKAASSPYELSTNTSLIGL